MFCVTRMKKIQPTCSSSVRSIRKCCEESKQLWGIRYAGIDDPIRIAEVVDQIEQMARRSPIWGLLWSTTSAAVWQLWRERNRRWHMGVHSTASTIANNLIADFKITFKEMKFKASHRTRSEARSWATWMSRRALDRPEEAHGLFASNRSLTTNEG